MILKPNLLKYLFFSFITAVFCFSNSRKCEWERIKQVLTTWITLALTSNNALLLWSMQFSGIGFSYPVKYKTILKLTKKNVRVFRFVARSKVLQPFFQLLRKTDHPIYCAHSSLRVHAYRVYNFGLKFINGVCSLQN